jgi:hypothetical protein
MTSRRGATKGEAILNGYLMEVNLKVVKSLTIGKVLQLLRKHVDRSGD